MKRIKLQEYQIDNFILWFYMNISPKDTFHACPKSGDFWWVRGNKEAARSRIFDYELECLKKKTLNPLTL